MADAAPIDMEVMVIDFGQERAVVIQQVLKAFEESGVFQLVNHGISKNLMDEAMKVYQEFYSLPSEEKVKYERQTFDPLGGGVALYKKSTQNLGKYWREILRHPYNEDEEEKKTWPDNPPRYREVIGTYSAELKRLIKDILALVSEGLGLEEGYFDKQLGMSLHGKLYPACPDTSGGPTLAVGGHYDANLITIIQQQVFGLQILNDGKLIDVEPLPHAFVFISGLPLTVISNGKLTSPKHRVIANSIQPRISIGTFVSPEDVVGPAKSCNPPMFKSMNWKNEYLPYYFSKQLVSLDAALEPFKIDPREK